MKKAQNRGTHRAEAEISRPDAGKDQREVVRGSRVHPASRPLPKGQTKVRATGEWGRARGEERTVTVARSDARMRPTVARRKTTNRPAASPVQKIAQENWIQFLDAFSREHEGWLIEVEVTQENRPSMMEAHGLPLHGITADFLGSDESAVSIILRKEGLNHLTHIVPQTRKITLFEKERRLEIESADGSMTLVYFRPATQT